ncbi:DUF3575 domain-containing protein [Flavobacteriaceae bacterium]|jgi:hypothetical protein|nr:DUF3575 domain-containing protein [Flavobacteriaceae bacterium]MDB4050380.1 DUF3575 domain-containing protein [Flavobacteriaceae bacterium]
MFKKTTSLLFLLIFTFGAAQTELKFNLASALILTPNIGIEVQLSEKFGYQLDTSATFFDNIEGSPFQTTQIFNELRYYPKLKEGKNERSFFIGPHVGYGMFTLRIPKFITSIVDTELKEEGSYQSGRNTYYGITVGKKIPLKNKNFNLEIFVGGGSSQSNYKYYNKEGNRIYENPDIEKDFNQSGEELVYKGGVMLTYKL